MSSNLLERLLTATDNFHAKKRDIEQELQNGADPNSVYPSSGISAMHVASGLGEEATALLLQHGGNPNVQSQEGITPLHIASSWGHEKTLQLLLLNGSDITLQDQDGKTAYDLAVEQGHEECTRLLKHHALMHTINSDMSPSSFETSMWEAEDFSEMYSDKITEQMYEYLAEGRPVCFDATSPDTPMIGMKPRNFTSSGKCSYAQESHLRDCAYQAVSSPHHSTGTAIAPEPYNLWSNIPGKLTYGTCKHSELTSPSCPNLSKHGCGAMEESASVMTLPKSWPCGCDHVSLWCPEMQACHSSKNSPCNLSLNLCHCISKLTSLSHPDISRHRLSMEKSDCLAALPKPFVCSCCHTTPPNFASNGLSPKALHNEISDFWPQHCGIHQNRFSSAIRCSTTSPACPGVNIRKPSFPSCKEYHSPASSPKALQSHPTSPKAFTLQSPASSPKTFTLQLPASSPKAFTLQSMRLMTPDAVTQQKTNQKHIHLCKDHDTLQDLTATSKGQIGHLKGNQAFLKTPDIQIDKEKSCSDISPISEIKFKLQPSKNNLLPSPRNFEVHTSLPSRNIRWQNECSIKSTMAKTVVADLSQSSGSDYFSGVASDSTFYQTSPKIFTDKRHNIVIDPIKEGVSGLPSSPEKNNESRYFPPLHNAVNVEILNQSYSMTGSQESTLKEDAQAISHLELSAMRISDSPLSKKTAFLPRSETSSVEKVAKFILSAQKFKTKCNLKENQMPNPQIPYKLTDDEILEDTSILDLQRNTEDSITKQQHMIICETKPADTSNSSEDTFATCENYEITCLQDSVHATEKKEINKNEILTNKTEENREHENLYSMKGKDFVLSRKWKAPIFPIPEDEIMTSDDSFIYGAHSSCVDKIKMKPDAHNFDVLEKIRSKKQNQDFSVLSEESNGFLANDLPINRHVTSRKIPIKSFENNKRLSSDSIFSTISVKEYVYRDNDSGITLIERHIPSECGSSIGRRSIDSTSSKTTIDSQATLIYDWRILNEVAKVSKRNTQSTVNNRYSLEEAPGLSDTHLFSSSGKYDNNDFHLSLESSSALDNDHPENEQLPVIIVPDHLERLTCAEISQELHKYGEIPGPVTPKTRQAYLRRLTSLESNPGLVKLTKSTPDYPCELRQALSGQFDSSGLEELEMKMSDAFNTNGRQWREGNVKSSFTYLLLDPRISNNLPLRAKEMTDLEVFKTFVCAVFYIGKGKRARPYCHLYEAVSKMNKPSSKMSAKIKHIIDIWNAGLGVVSLHCFQSVIPVEAYTREACMIEAIGIHKVTNMKKGDFYGVVSTWTMQQRRKLGVHLLKKALQIFLAEGERQICIPDLKSS